MRLLAIGGGGFTHREDPALDTYLLSLLPTAARLGYVGHANQDDPVRLQYFDQTFAGRVAAKSHLPIEADLVQTRSWLTEQDAVYVAGGDTAVLIQHWQHSGLHHAFAEAARAGVLLAGVSAGAVCWFESCLSDLPVTGLSPLPGFGLFKGSCCPHFDSEPARQPAYRDHIAAELLLAGLAIDDGVGVLLDEDGVLEVVSGRAFATAQHIAQSGDGLIEQPFVVKRLLPAQFCSEG